MPIASFIVIGAAKCGTSSLCDLLSAHPDVFMTAPKEPHYFSRLTTFEQLRDWYTSLFDGSETYGARGEGSTSYTHPHRIDFVVPRLGRVIPDCRLVYIIRNPIRRLESDWKMRRREGRAPASINDAVEQDASLVTFGLYWKHLSAYRRMFRDDQIMVVFLEDMAEHPIRELRRVFQHIGVDPDFAPKDPGRRRNGAEEYRRETAIAAVIRRAPGFGSLKRLLPPPVLEATKQVLLAEYRDTVDWDAPTLRAINQLYARDSQMILAFCGKPADYWDLGDGGTGSGSMRQQAGCT